MKKKHICFVTKYYGRTKNGPGTFADNFIRSVMKNDEYNLTVISGESSKSKYGEIIYNYNSTNNFKDGFSIRNLINFINKLNRIDVVYFNCYKNAIASTKINIPYFVNVNDFNNFNGKRKFIWNFIGMEVFNHAEKIFVNSEYTKQNIPKVNKFKGDKFKVTGKGIKVESFKFKYNEIDDHINILFVGSNYALKGLGDLLKAIQVLKTKTALKIYLNIIGEPMSNSDKFIHLVKDLGLYPNVNFCGVKSKEEIVDYHNISHFFVLPSYKEAFGVSLLESLASGTSVIASNAGGIPSIIEDGVSGLLVELGDFNSIADNIIKLTNDKKLRFELAKNGLNRVEKFDFEKIFNLIMNDISARI